MTPPRDHGLIRGFTNVRGGGDVAVPSVDQQLGESRDGSLNDVLVGIELHSAAHRPGQRAVVEVENGCDASQTLWKLGLPGRVGETVSIEQGTEAAQWTAMNAPTGMKQAFGDLERVVSPIKSLNFVPCAPTFTDVHVISTAMADRLVEVLGPARGIGARATIGVQSLAGNHCYESWIEVEILR